MNRRSRVNPFTFEGALEVLKRNLFSSILTICMGVLIALIFYYRMHRIYIADTTLVIPTSFFSLAGGSEETQNTPGELDAYRLALVRQIFTDYFLDALGERYGIFYEAIDAPKHSLERQALRSRFTVSIAAPSTVRISATGASGQEAAGLLEDCEKELLKVLKRRVQRPGEETEVDEAKLLTVLQPPQIPETPIYPRRSDYLRAGFGLGLLLSLFQLVYREYRLSRFLFPEEISSILKIEYFGELPEISRLEWLYLIDHVKQAQQRLIAHDES